VKALLPVVLLALALAVPAAASEQRPTLPELESEIVCPACNTTLDQSSSAIAKRMKDFIAERIAAGDSKSEIKAQLVDQFGERVLASPPREGFNLLVWVLPLVALLGGAAVLGTLVWRWSRDARPTYPPGEPSQNGHRPLGPEAERRLDEALARFDE
jgi:cytochrome c-type biogenesis protein CcmH